MGCDHPIHPPGSTPAVFKGKEQSRIALMSNLWTKLGLGVRVVWRFYQNNWVREILLDLIIFFEE